MFFCISLCQSHCSLLETLAGFQAKLVKSFGPLEVLIKNAIHKYIKKNQPDKTRETLCLNRWPLK